MEFGGFNSAEKTLAKLTKLAIAVVFTRTGYFLGLQNLVRYPSASAPFSWDLVPYDLLRLIRGNVQR